MAANTLSTLNGNTRRVYGEVHDLIPKTQWLLTNIPWDRGNKVGDSFHELIILSNENGITHGGSTGAAFTLLAAAPMATAPASVTPYEYVIRVAISYGAASRASRAGREAFKKSILMVLNNGMESLGRRLEGDCIYGQSAKGLGQVAIGAIVDISATQHWLVFAESQWAPGLWQGSEGAIVWGYQASDDTVIASSGDSDMTIAAVDFANRRIKVTAVAGLITAVETANDTIAVNVYWKGARTNSMLGIDYIFQNTTGTVHGISAATYGNWAGNYFTLPVAGQLTHAHVVGYAAELQARGLQDEDLILLCNPKTWADLHQEQAASRVYDESYEKAAAVQGFKAIRYYTSSGWISVVAHSMVKGGECFMFPKSVVRRIGSGDREWNLPGADGSDPWFPIADTAAAEARIYADQTIFCESPNVCCKIDGIVNTFGTTG